MPLVRTSSPLRTSEPCDPLQPMASVIMTHRQALELRQNVAPEVHAGFSDPSSRHATTASRRSEAVLARGRKLNAIESASKRANPYGPQRLGPENRRRQLDLKTGRQRQLWCLAISAKRYTLFLRDRYGEPALLREGVNNAEDRYSEHGLGHLLNPADPESEDRNWIAAGVAFDRAPIARPLNEAAALCERVAVGRTTVSSPA